MPEPICIVLTLNKLNCYCDNLIQRKILSASEDRVRAEPICMVYSISEVLEVGHLGIVVALLFLAEFSTVISLVVPDHTCCVADQALSL